ncbi:hypothetical protein BDW_09070 [Bdellovibrio bacteriovorus W]|nr:hypothetical protein BDW_09070 [Bdellovibrio bacteriovorus W]
MLSFHRQISIGLKLKKPLTNGRQGFSFSLAVGFSAAVEPLTGMSVSLPLVDQWLHEEKASLQGQEFDSVSADEVQAAHQILTVLQKSLFQKSSLESVTLAKLEADFQEFEISWDPQNGFAKTLKWDVEVPNSLGSYGRCELLWTSSLDALQPVLPTSFKSLEELLKTLKSLKPSGTICSVQDLARSEQWKI